jgi:23S rRNA (guanosine2251-2'-O)-methyltransferase
MSPISPESLKRLREILKLGHEIERNYELLKVSERQVLLNELAKKFSALAGQPESEVQKISRYAEHLKPELQASQFVHFLVPVERLCQTSVADHDFMVTSQDQAPMTLQRLPLHIFLDHWRSAFNVGSVFRTADGLGIEKIHLSGYTATPENQLVKKTALGSESFVPWQSHANSIQALTELQKNNYQIIGFETTHKSLPLAAPFNPLKTVFVFGNERFGLNDDVLQLCDELRQIPMIGIKNSLNAAVCMALASYEWKSQWLNRSL